jgi:hypothetical protein
MSSWFSDQSAGAFEQDNPLVSGPSPYDDEERRRQEQLQGPVYGPPAPTGGIAPQNMPVLGQPQGAPQEFAPSVPFDPSLVASFVNQQGAPVNYGPWQPTSLNDLPPAPTLASQAGLPTGGFRQSEQLVDPNARTDNPLALLSGAYGAGNVDIPYYSDFARDYIQPAARFVGESATNTPGYNLIANRLGLPTGQQIGGTAAEGIVPVGALDVGLNAAFAPKGAGLLERFTGITISDAVGEARNLAGDYARGMQPEPTLFPGVGSGPNAYNYEQWAADAAKQAGTPAESYWRYGERAAPDVSSPPSLEDLLRQSLEAKGVTFDEKPFFAERGPPQPEGTTPGLLNELETAHRPNPAGYTQPLEAFPSDMPVPPPPLPESAVFPEPPYNTNELRGAQGPTGEVQRLAANPPVTPPVGTGNAPENLPNLAGLSNGQIVAEANRLGLKVDPAALDKGGALLRAEVLAPVDAAIDLERRLSDIARESTRRDNIGSMGRATEDFFANQREQRQLEQAIKQPPPSPEARLPGKGAGGDAFGKPRANNPIASLYNALQEVSYMMFGGDGPPMFRQLDMRTLSPFTAGETAAKFKAAARATSSDEAAKMTQEWIDRVTAVHPDMTNHVNFSNTKGEWVDREFLSSSIPGHIPKVGPAYDGLQRAVAASINENRVLGLEAFSRRHPEASLAELKNEWNYLERATGRGTFGPTDKVLSGLGSVFTSARFALSWPERAAFLIPINRLPDGTISAFGKTWSEAVRDHAGFFGMGAAAMGTAYAAGLNVDVKKGDIVNLHQHIDIWGGGSKYAELIMNMINETKNGKDMSRPELLAQFARNQLGPLIGNTAAALKETGADDLLGIADQVKALHPDFWDRGVTGKNLGLADRIAQHFVPLWIQSVAKNVMAESGPDNKVTSKGLAQGAIAAPLEFFGANATAYVPNPLTDLRDAVKNDQSLPEWLRGTDYKELGPKAKAEVDALARAKDPTAYDQAIKDRNANSDPVFTKHRELVDSINAEADARKSALYEALRTGQVDGSTIRQGREAIEASARAKLQAAQNDPGFQKAVAGLDESKVQRALSAYYSIPEKYMGADGKIDWDTARSVQNQFIKFLGENNRQTANLLLHEIQTPKANPNPLDRLYEAAQPVLQKYFGDVKDPVERSNMRRGAPGEDALLNLLGYEQRTLTPQAASLLQQLRQTLPTATTYAEGALQRSAVPGMTRSTTSSN